MNIERCPGLSTQSISNPTTVPDDIRVVSDDTNLEPQAGVFCHESIPNQQQNSAITEFRDQNPSYTCVIESEPDPTRWATADADSELGNFFERPVRIASYAWPVGGRIDSVFNPWTLWLANPRVANRVTNFKLFRGTMHVKFLINGNQFYWGRTLASYLPYTDSSFYRTDTSSLSRMPATQRPHLWIDPSTSQGGEMVLPFFYYADAIDLTAVGSANPLGSIWLDSFVELQHTQNLTNNVDITVMAWVTDIELSAPTNTNFAALSPQSGGDEYGDGVISRPANITAAIARKLEQAPVIGPFAMATSLAAGAVGNIAKMFGYARPRQIADSTRVNVNQSGNLASTDAVDTSITLAFTSKQEVTIDPRTTGLGGQDELDFDYLCQKHSWYTTAPWTLSDAQYYPLVSVAVTPMIFNVANFVLPTTNDGYGLTTTAFVAQPFDYWRGSISYRFQIVGSGYHKGRLLAVWDPCLPSVTPELNTVYSKIIDIAEERDFTITVGWGARLPALRVDDPVIGQTTNPPYKIGSLHNPTIVNDNGVLTLYVMNNLVSSGANTSPVQILCHAYSNDLQVFEPSSDNIRDLCYVPQSGSYEPESGIVESDENTAGVVNAAEETEVLQPVGGQRTNMSTMGITAGEVVRSFRTCMKRYSLRRNLMNYLPVTPDAIYITNWTGTSYFGSPGITYSGGTLRDPMIIQAYVTNAYSAWRGSTRHKIFPVSRSHASTITVARGEGLYGDVSVSAVGANTVALRNALKPLDESWSGCEVSTHASGHVVDIELPWYSQERFATPGSLNFGTNAMSYTATIPTIVTSAGNLGEVYSEYSAIGEDFNTFFFLGVPPMWRLEA